MTEAAGAIGAALMGGDDGDDAAAAKAAAAAAGGDGADAAAAAAAAAAAGGDDGGASSWFAKLSADAPDDKTLSDRAWAENKKYAGVEDLVKAARGLERQMGSEKLPLPKDLNDPVAMADVWKALGRPDDAKGYDLPVPEGQDKAFAGKFAEVAHRIGMPATMAKSAVEWWNGEAAAAQQAAADAAAAKVTSERAELRREWGKDFKANSEIIGLAAERFGFTVEEITALQGTLGTKATAAKLLAIGKAMGEDTLSGGGARPLGTLTAEAATTRKAAILADPAAMAKINAKDPAALAEWNAIGAAMAADEEAKGRL